jgi:hypothetical protein
MIWIKDKQGRAGWASDVSRWILYAMSPPSQSLARRLSGVSASEYRAAVPATE